MLDKGVIAGLLVIVVIASTLTPIAAQEEQLTVSIWSPTDRMDTLDSSIEVLGKVTGFQGAASEVQVIVTSPASSVTVAVDESGIFSASVDLVDGINLITVEAMDAYGSTGAANVTVIKSKPVYLPPSPQPISQQISIPADASADFYIELTGTGRCKIAFSGMVENIVRSFGEQAPKPSGQISNVGWDLNLTARAPEAGRLLLSVSGWVVLPLSQRQASLISGAVLAYRLSPLVYNQQIMEQLESYLKVEVVKLDISRIDFDINASKLTFSLEMEIQSQKIDASVMEELPLSIVTTGSGTFPEGPGNFIFKMATASSSAVLNLNLQGNSLQASGVLEFMLRSDPLGLVTRSENEISINFGALRDRVPQNFSITAAGQPKISLRIKAPPNARVQGLPPEYEISDGAWVWKGQHAVAAISSLLRGDRGTIIRYPLVTSVAAIQNIQEKVGQTIQIENNYVRSVQIESATALTVNFEEIYEIRKVGILFASAAQTAQVTVRVLPGRPSGIEPPPNRKIHYYFTIDETATGGGRSGSVEFKVSKIWIAANDIDINTVALLHYSNGWQELKTQKTGGDENHFYFAAELPGFSIFAVSALPTQPTWQFPSIYLILAAFVVVVIILLAVIWRHVSRSQK